MAKPITAMPVLEILPPPEPELNIWFTLLITAMLFAIVISLYRYWLSRPRQRARRGLQQLQRQIDQGVDLKHCVFEINRLLCLGFQQAELVRFNANDKQTDWQRFYHKLSTAQYQAATPDKQQTRFLLTTAQQLLKDIKS